MRKLNLYISEKLHLNKDIKYSSWDNIIDFFVKVINEGEMGGSMEGYWFMSTENAEYEYDMLKDGSTKDYCKMLETSNDFKEFLKDENIDNLSKEEIEFLKDHHKTEEAKQAMRKAYIKKAIEEQVFNNEKAAEKWLDYELSSV
jgi:hypothetical protein